MKNIPLKHLSGFYPYSLTGKISNFIFRSSMFESLLGYCDYGDLAMQRIVVPPYMGSNPISHLYLRLSYNW